MNILSYTGVAETRDHRTRSVQRGQRCERAARSVEAEGGRCQQLQVTVFRHIPTVCPLCHAWLPRCVRGARPVSPMYTGADLVPNRAASHVMSS